MKKYLFFAASALALASCSSDDFLGENPGNVQNATTAINFGGDAGKISRATSNTGDVINMLDGQFKIYGVKKVSDTQFHNVFVNYSVWDVADKNTTSNTKGWEYVADAGSKDLGKGKIELVNPQTIKFWDYSSPEYHFVAGSPVKNFTYYLNNSSFDIAYAKVTGLAGHITANATGERLNTDPIYVAAPKKVVKAEYPNPVEFTFIRQQSMVRVGFYETIPGYFISNINFYEYNAAKATVGNNIILNSSTPDYFVGGSNISSTVDYVWTPTPSYSFKYSDEGLAKSQNWYAGKLEHGVRATTSTEKIDKLYGTDKDMELTTGYFTVLPTPSATEPSAILIKCDYTLTSEDGCGETINVRGATAAIPAAFSKWDVNTRYTYLFKISQNTNGTTSDPSDPNPEVGLYPITFNAVVKEMADKTQGTITTVTTPSITTYQAGSVTDNGIEYKPGTAIDVTVTNAKGEVQTLSKDGTAVGNVAVYKLSTKKTEADLQITNVAKSELTTTNSKEVTLAAGNKSFTFTPTEVGHYAIQYLTTAATAEGTPAAYTYKVVNVQ